MKGTPAFPNQNYSARLCRRRRVAMESGSERVLGGGPNPPSCRLSSVLDGTFLTRLLEDMNETS